MTSNEFPVFVSRELGFLPDTSGDIDFLGEREL